MLSEWPLSPFVHSSQGNDVVFDSGHQPSTVQSPSFSYPTRASTIPPIPISSSNQGIFETLGFHNNHLIPFASPSPVDWQDSQVIHSDTLNIIQCPNGQREVQCPRCDRVIKLFFTRMYYNLRTHMNSANCENNGMLSQSFKVLLTTLRDSIKRYVRHICKTRTHTKYLLYHRFLTQTHVAFAVNPPVPENALWAFIRVTFNQTAHMHMLSVSPLYRIGLQRQSPVPMYR